ncbi:MAG: serine/threonine protein kinase, partial [Deltaproteobacteria bacterium]|nr:serine/threonine protein kinase [Deltaproteobacteria bacterium]
MPEHGRYTISRKIAEGGMAEIFLGTQHGAAGFQRPVVVKRIHAVFSASPQFRNMFVDEAHIAMSLNQGNIVQVLDLGMVGGRYFLILELVDGWDLNRILERAEAEGWPLPPELALYIVAEVGRGLAFAHGREREGRPLGIVHRDVSPHNVLISEQGEVKLSDFGIATAENRREQTLAGTVKGKIGFMSPEQASGKAIDARSDVFSLGATLYLTVTGKRPFAARSDLEALLRTQACDFPAPLVARPDLHPEVAKIVEKAMKKSPLARYQSAEQMLLDVERVQRSVLKPVGKTELKAWLTELAARDGAPPTSRAAAFASDGAPGELPLDGSVIVLGDSDLEPAGPRTLAGVDSRPAAPGAEAPAA